MPGHVRYVLDAASDPVADSVAGLVGTHYEADPVANAATHRIAERHPELRRCARPAILRRSGELVRRRRLCGALPGDVRGVPTPVAVIVANDLRAVAAADPGPEPVVVSYPGP